MNQSSASFIATVIAGTIKEVTGEAPEWFLGGSYRFGWAEDGSDIDVVVSVSPPKQTALLLIGTGFFLLDRENTEAYHSILLATHLFGHSVHVMLVDPVQFQLLAEDHAMVDSLLVENPQLLLLVRSLREQMYIPGAMIYTALLEVPGRD